MKTEVGLLIILLFASLPFLACENTVSGDGPIDVVFPDTNVSYGGQVQPLFDRGCSFLGCHSADEPADGLSLESYQDALSSKIGVILPRDTANSRIIWRIEGTHGVRRMPLDRTPLNQNQINGIRRWILEGARNN